MLRKVGLNFILTGPPIFFSFSGPMKKASEKNDLATRRGRLFPPIADNLPSPKNSPVEKVKDGPFSNPAHS